MNHNLHPVSSALLDETMIDMNIPNTDEHRQSMCTVALNLGLACISLHRGLFQALNEKFKMDTVKPTEIHTTEIPIVCPDCNKAVVNVPGRLVCNCRVWKENE